MKQKSKKKRILIICLAIVIVLVVGVLVGGGNYLVTFAIARSTGLQNIVPTTTLSEDSLEAIHRNWQEQAEKARQWTESSQVETVQIKAADGLELSAQVIKGAVDSHLWVIGVHGYRVNHESMVTPVSVFGQRGFHALLPDLRGCGETGGDYVGMGWPDRKDMLEWIRWITDQDEEAQIVLYGISMGGATVMMTAGEELPSQVKAVVEDCGYTSVWDIFEDEMAYLFHLPSFPLLNVASGFSRLRAGYGFQEASALEQVKKAKVPILFIHGSEDNFVHTEMVYRLYDACQSEKQLCVIEGAGHGNSYNHDPEVYYGTIFDFLDSYVEGMTEDADGAA